MDTPIEEKKNRLCPRCGSEMWLSNPGEFSPSPWEPHWMCRNFPLCDHYELDEERDNG